MSKVSTGVDGSWWGLYSITKSLDIGNRIRRETYSLINRLSDTP